MHGFKLMELDLRWKTSSYSTGQEILRIFQSRQFINVLTKTHNWTCPGPVNVTHPSDHFIHKPRIGIDSILLSSHFHKNLLISHLPQIQSMIRRFHSPSFNHSNATKASKTLRSMQLTLEEYSQSLSMSYFSCRFWVPKVIALKNPVFWNITFRSQAKVKVLLAAWFTLAFLTLQVFRQKNRLFRNVD